MQHFDYLSQSRHYVLLITFMVAILIGFAGAEALAQGDAPVTKIEHNDDVYLGHKDTVKITLEENTENFSYDRFDLTVMYNTDILTFLGGWMGEFVDSCGWESFDLSEQTAGIITISAQADLDGMPPSPACFLDAEQVVLAELEFQVTDDFAYECHWVPLRFYWEDCEDNMYWSTSTDWIYVSDQVMDYVWWGGYINIAVDTTLPTIHGSPDSCAAITEGGPRARWMDFHNGGIDIVCADSIDARGDLNLNNIANEIADYVLYANYFLFGLSVFDIDVAAQIAASDINNDGLVLTIPDLVYLYRIIIGDALPFPSPDKQPAESAVAQLVQDTAASTVGLNYPDILACVYLRFSGEIVPELTPNIVDMDLQYNFDGVETRVLITPLEFEPLLTGGPFLGYSGDGLLVYAEVADNSGLVLIESSIYTGFPLDINGAIYLINYIFAGGFPPIPLEAGDVNCDEVVDIDDVVYLIQYVFAGGPEPYVDCP